MEPDASLEGRLRYIEQASQQLKQQMQVMKTLVTTEVEELRGVLRQQVEDMKQIVIHQDRLYSERIKRLEERVQQLAEFSMHLAQSKGMMGSLSREQVSLPVDSPATARKPSLIAEPEAPLPAAPVAAIGFAHDSDDEDIDGRGGYQAILAKYSEKINQVYRHYTETASRALHPVMTLQQFTKLTKDCGLCNSSAGGTVAVNAYLPPPELLWMNVLRRLPQKRKKGKLSSGNFAYERVQEVTREVFPDMIVVLAEEQYGRDRPDMDRAQVVELFLVNDLFSVTDQKIASAENQKLHQREKRQTPHAASSINDYYDNEDVRDCLKQYRTKINNTYQLYVERTKSRKGNKNLTLQGFSDIIKDHGLLPLISKSDVREIFLNVLHSQEVLSAMGYTASQLESKQVDDLEVDRKGFYMTLRHVAEHIYGDRSLAEKYPTPDARLRKLMSKMYLLAGN
eukprot:TRINITY_DN11463_c0_g1_i2.p1 TRINITY_DN11463_c0_g1~~TRINITY_DN11463_c0_g1_i2.p1  ORF type:complete len:453 (+),score=186.17 TRINITY_DN11463_c0_g1_i2:105-1463(+)